MSELRRPWFTLTKNGSVLPAVIEVVLGALGLVVQLLTITSGGPVETITLIVCVVAVLLVAQGVADLVWWSRGDRRARAQSDAS
ncbi:hypothetical protein ES689_09560 [Frigoribacterium sp. ACAM 257]|uniref:hypothetical protein n=1 Tax=Frigoribacterium sp. ACAM 257 TaxID=2508998 RepID=UPI0011BA46DE|nr:hypothetical protein [Frigoribacterium sp. ACAM 257]TWX38839.1 hypothetical protein ES689_09560 [Frigoribacterium sp. ACAM 257]